MDYINCRKQIEIGFDEREAQDIIDEGVRLNVEAWALRADAEAKTIEEKP